MVIGAMCAVCIAAVCRVGRVKAIWIGGGVCVCQSSYVVLRTDLSNNLVRAPEKHLGLEYVRMCVCVGEGVSVV